MRAVAWLVCSVAALAVVIAEPQRIVGGSVTTIEDYPSMVAMLFSKDLITFSQICGGTILTNRMILTAAHCTHGTTISQWRGRVGSSYANSGGEVYTFYEYVNYPLYDVNTINYDIGIVRTTEALTYSSSVQRVGIASSNYILEDNSSVWVTGWGVTDPENPKISEDLKHVQVYTINQEECRNRYATINSVISYSMLCTGVLDVGGRDQCYGDSGGPLYHNGVVVGVYSWAGGCNQPYFPSVNTRVSAFSGWISGLAV